MNLNFKIIILKSLLYEKMINYNFIVIIFNYQKLIIVINSYILFFTDKIFKFFDDPKNR